MKQSRPLFMLILILVLGGIAWTGSTKAPQADEAEGKFKIAYLDIGQGDAILMTTPHNHHILIDGGPDTSILSRLGEELKFNEHTIDLAIVSHNHSDHIGGLNAAMERYDVKKLWISGAIHTTNDYLELLDTIRHRKIATETVWNSKTADIDGVQLHVIHPMADATGLRPDDQHDATVVVRVTYGQKSFLMTGDINEGHEQAMIKADVPLQADILKVAHHGSASGLALNFLERINPTYAVIQSGANNKFGHPAPSIIKKLQNKGVTIFRNDQNGTVTAITDGTTLSVTSQK
jgi:competence protein ComEC